MLPAFLPCLHQDRSRREIANDATSAMLLPRAFIDEPPDLNGRGI
jgi:hypothetical protein